MGDTELAVSQKLHVNQEGPAPIVGIRLPWEMRRAVQDEASRTHESVSVVLRRIISEWSSARAERLAQEGQSEVEADAAYQLRKIEVATESKPAESDMEPEVPMEPIEKEARRTVSETALPTPKVDISPAKQRRLIAMALRSTQRQTESKASEDRELKRRQRAEALSLEKQRAQERAEREARKRARLLERANQDEGVSHGD